MELVGWANAVDAGEEKKGNFKMENRLIFSMKGDGGTLSV